MKTALVRLNGIFEFIEAKLAEHFSMGTSKLFYENLKVIVYKGGRGGKAVHSFTCDKPRQCGQRIVDAFTGLPSTLIPRFELEDLPAPYRIAVVAGNVEIFTINTRMSNKDTHFKMNNYSTDMVEKNLMDAVDNLQKTLPPTKKTKTVEVDRQGDETVIMHPGYTLESITMVLKNVVTGEVKIVTP